MVPWHRCKICTCRHEHSSQIYSSIHLFFNSSIHTQVVGAEVSLATSSLSYVGIISTSCPGPNPSRSCLIKEASRRYSGQIHEPPQLTPFDVGEWWLFFKPLLKNRAVHPTSKEDPRYPAHFYLLQKPGYWGLILELGLGRVLKGEHLVARPHPTVWKQYMGPHTSGLDALCNGQRSVVEVLVVQSPNDKSGYRGIVCQCIN